MPAVKDTFAARPAVKSPRGVAQATALIIALRQQQARAQAALDAELQEVEARHAKHFTCLVKGGRVPISERIAQLESAVDSYVKRERGTVFSAGSQTTDFGAATVQLRNEAGRIEFQPGQNRRTVAAGLVAVEGWREAVLALLEEFQLAGWIVLQPDLDWDGLKRGLKSGAITAAEVREYGMDWVAPTRVRITGN